MKILYAIQGTGNGHLSRARAIVPALRRHGTVDLLVSGTESEVHLPWPVDFRCTGLGFVFGKKGGIDYAQTYKRSNVKKLFREIRALPVGTYDVVISDFEPVSAWACALHGQPCLGLSHQVAVACKKAPRPARTDLVGKAVLKYYAPVTHAFGFHFLPYAGHIFPPVIRQEVRALEPVNRGHYTVYLPAYSDERIIRYLRCFPEVPWEVFSKEARKPFFTDNISIYPISNEGFLHSMGGAEGVFCGAGFETPAEALYLKKKLLVVPMKGQYEQQCNAAALKALGVPVLKNLKPKGFACFHQWLSDPQSVHLPCPDETNDIVTQVLEAFRSGAQPRALPRRSLDSSSAFRERLLKKIFYQNGTS
ncbi:MAG TPA: glycosyltransferase family protein [Chitinophagaceae bacterium]|jgi:uncharacterized protein (TIGR00661 family)|nr:glycosyltransferase family protein [Chitinophagaceae bacterium]